MTTAEIRHSNKTILDMRKVAYARFFYRSKDYQYERDLMPTNPTVRGQEIGGAALYHPDYPNESTFDRAKRLGVLDKWIPVWVCILNNGHRLEYTGEKAIKMRDKYNSIVFPKKN